MVGQGRAGPVGPRTLVVSIGDVGAPAWMARLCADVGRELALSRAERLVCDVGAVRYPDAATVDVLARLLVTARRAGSDAVVRAASPELLWLVRLMGLDGVLRCDDASGVDAVGEPEEREELLRVEEEGDPADPIA